MQSNELYIGNLDIKTKPTELRTIFQYFGNINRCIVKANDATHYVAYGFVGFETTEEAEFAKQQMSGLIYRGRPMIVQMTKTKPGGRQQRDRFIGLEHTENRHSHKRDQSPHRHSHKRDRSPHRHSHERDRSHHRHRRRSSSYSRRSKRDENKSDDRHRKRDRSRSSSYHKSSSKRRRLSSDDDRHHTSHSHQNGNSKRR